MEKFKSLSKYENLEINYIRCKCAYSDITGRKKIIPIEGIGSHRYISQITEPALCVNGNRAILEVLYKDLLEETEDKQEIYVTKTNKGVYIYYKDPLFGSTIKPSKA